MRVFIEIFNFLCIVISLIRTQHVVKSKVQSKTTSFQTRLQCIEVQTYSHQIHTLMLIITLQQNKKPNINKITKTRIKPTSRFKPRPVRVLFGSNPGHGIYQSGFKPVQCVFNILITFFLGLGSQTVFILSRQRTRSAALSVNSSKTHISHLLQSCCYTFLP